MSTRQVKDKLRDRGFRLVSQNRHKKFRDAQGRTIIVSASPSDVNAELAQLRDIERISSTPVHSPVVSRSSTAALSPAAKRKAGAVGNGNGNGKVATYIKTNAPLTSQEQREADRLESEWLRLRQRMESSCLLLGRQCNAALTYAYQLAAVVKVRREGAKQLAKIKKDADFTYQRYLRERQAVYAQVKYEAKKYAGNLTMDLEAMMPWLLGLTEKADLSSDQPPEKRWKGGIEWALAHFASFVHFPKWMGVEQQDPHTVHPTHRRAMRFFPPPAGLRKF